MSKTCLVCLTPCGKDFCSGTCEDAYNDRFDSPNYSGKGQITTYVECPGCLAPITTAPVLTENGVEFCSRECRNHYYLPATLITFRDGEIL